jgi:hypothetical protein
MSEIETGYYWVRTSYDGDWQILARSKSTWWHNGRPVKIDGDWEISPRIKTPDEL